MGIMGIKYKGILIISIAPGTIFSEFNQLKIKSSKEDYTHSTFWLSLYITVLCVFTVQCTVFYCVVYYEYSLYSTVLCVFTLQYCTVCIYCTV